MSQNQFDSWEKASSEMSLKVSACGFILASATMDWTEVQKVLVLGYWSLMYHSCWTIISCAWRSISLGWLALCSARDSDEIVFIDPS